MSIQEEIKAELLKEIFSNIDNLYEFIDYRFNLDKTSNDVLIKQLNELKDVLYKISELADLK